MGTAPMAYVALDALPAPRPDAPGLARPRPVRAVGRARHHAPLLAPPPDRLRRLARRPEGVPPVGQRSRPGHPEYGLTPGRRGDDRTARPGLHERRRHGHRRAAPGGRVQPPGPRRSSTTGRTSSLRRRPPGGHRVGGGRPGRPPAPRQARRPLRRQPHPARRADVDGLVARTCSARFDAYGWHTQRVADGNDVEAIAAAIEAARADDRPSLIAVRTHIGFGSPNKQDSQKAHGAPLGPDEVRLTKEAYGWDPDRDVLRAGRGAGAVPRGRPGRRGARRRVGGPASTAYAPRTPTRPPSSAGATGRRAAATGWDADLPDVRDRRRGRHPQRQPGGHPAPWRRACPSCSAAPRTCPSRT